MANLKWDEAITKVLEEAKTSLHYEKITERIFEKQYREGGGATPAATVNKILGSNINTYKEKSPFVKVGMGVFILRKFLDNLDQHLTEVEQETEAEKNKIINAFGIYWNRDFVSWKSSPDLLGVQQIGADEVNFKEQIGIYLLHDNRETIYVGQAIGQSLGQRLKHHTSDRLSGRWDRFSWFGFYSVNDKGILNKREKFDSIGIQELADTLESILIESIEPRQNRKQGNTFSGIEYLQKESPEIKKQKKEQLIKELTDKL
ncbi:hypothetical protein KAW50_04225 [candidate division WOR-3 bacterium]|nr:hypothetical protein [candidate division WOR-3 bacterium]